MHILKKKRVEVMTPRTSPLVNMCEEMAAALDPVQRKLLKLLRLSNYLCCISVMHGERAAGRLILSEERADQVIPLIKSLGVHCHRSKYDVLLQSNLVEGTDHRCRFVPRGAEPDARAMIYFAVDKDFAEGLETVELHGGHELAGRLFGYPECCSRFFAQDESGQQDKTPRSIPGIGPFPRGLNPAIYELYGLSLLFHFPCSPLCAESHAILKRHQQYIAKYTSSYDLIDGLGAGIALYGPTIGISLITRYGIIDNNTFSVEAVTTRNEKIAELFSDDDAAQVRLISPHLFEVGGKVFDDQNHFAALFV